MSNDGSSDSQPFPDDPELFDEEGDSMAFGIGLGHGFARLDPKPESRESAKHNRYYYYPGYMIGYVVKVAVIVALYYTGAGGI